MKKIIILVLCHIVFSSFIICMQQPTRGESELFEAIKNGDAKRVQQLIDEGVNFITARIMYKGTEIDPINFAAEKGKSEIVKIIQGANYLKLTLNDRFLTAVKEDILGNNIPKIEKIIINGRIANVDDPNDGNNNTALILAVQKNDVPLVIRLLLWKADINILNTKGESALTLALKSKNKPLITALLENAYNIEIDQPDSDGNTPLILAVLNGDLEIIEKIVNEVPNLAATNEKGETVYDFIKEPNKTKILELLEKAKKQYALYEVIRNPSSISIDIKKFDVPFNIPSVERNPFVVAAKSKPGLVTEIKKKANVNQVLRGRRTFLWITVPFTMSSTFFYFLMLGADPNIADIYDDYTPIFVVLNYNKPLLLQYLIDSKANINYQASSKFPGEPGKMTPLMIAARAGQSDFVKTLLDAGADPLLKNSEGKTAVDIAREKEKTVIKNKEAYKTVLTLLENKIKNIPAKPVIPTTSAHLMSFLQDLTQQLRMLGRKLTV